MPWAATIATFRGTHTTPVRTELTLYVNTPEVVAQELQRKRKKPQRVYFSPSSDAFQYLPQVQDVSLRTMAVLLGAGIEIAFLTKGFIAQAFLGLFAAHAERVFAQIGITTLDRGLWRRFEPRTAPPHMRVAAIEALVRLGIHTTVRLDPLIPGLTDSDDNLPPLLRALSQAGVRDAAASYLFLRPQFAGRVQALIRAGELAGADRALWPYQEFADGSGGGAMLAREERAKRLAHLEALGNSVGIRIRPCRCKNPEFAPETCGITGPRLRFERVHQRRPLSAFTGPIRFRAARAASSQCSACRRFFLQCRRDRINLGDERDIRGSPFVHTCWRVFGPLSPPALRSVAIRLEWESHTCRGRTARARSRHRATRRDGNDRPLLPPSVLAP